VPRVKEYGVRKLLDSLPTPGRSGAKVEHLLRVPDPTSSAMLAAFVARSKRKVVPFAPGFVRRPSDDPTLPMPLLAEMLRGGRGGEVRLKLYLSMNLIAVRAPHDVTRKPASWAAMLGLPDKSRNGARRVGDAIDWLVDRKLIRAEKQKGGPAKVFLLDQNGSGDPYERPKGLYVNVPVALWQNGWIVTLSQAAVAMWVITKEMQRGQDNEGDPPVWIAPGVARVRYGVSADTWTKGTRELERCGLLRIDRAPQGQEWEWDRLRNTYHLILSHLQDRPDSSPSEVQDRPDSSPPEPTFDWKVFN
jgi:hypothetical protein